MKRPLLPKILMVAATLASMILSFSPAAHAESDKEILQRMWEQADKVEWDYNTRTHGKTLEIELLGNPQDTHKRWSQEIRRLGKTLNQLHPEANTPFFNQNVDCVHIVCHER